MLRYYIRQLITKKLNKNNCVILNILVTVYSMFALCEYSAVLSNIFFHQQSYNIVKDTYLLIINEHQPLDDKEMWNV